MSQYKNIKGGAELQKFLDQLPAKVEKNIMRSALRAGAKPIAGEAKRLVSVDKGVLRDGIKISTSAKGGKVTASIKAGGKEAWLAHIIEFTGAAPHYIRVQDSEKPINTRRGRNFGKTVSMRTINRNVLIIGNTFVGPTVHHPGMKPVPFMRPALDNKETEAVKAVAEQVRKRLTKEGMNASPVEVDDVG